jgi:hypothetical protein
METKMRIKLYEAKENQPPELLSDRLVEQSTEFNSGPKHKHKGPLSLELNLRDKEDCEKAIVYIGKLALDLPLEATEKPKKVKKVLDNLSDDAPLQDLIEQMSTVESQEILIKELQSLNFKFMTHQQLVDMNEITPGLVEVPNNLSDWQFMVRLLKLAKNPVNDKWDTRLIFAIKIRGERKNRVNVLLWGKPHTKFKTSWESEEEINFKKKDRLITFPEFMDYPMRSKFRAERRKYDLHIESGSKEAFEFSDFYKKWEKYIGIK